MQLTPTEAKSTLETEGDLNLPVLNFIKDTTPASFIAEHAVEETDIIYHFFPPQHGILTTLWKQTFPECLEKVAVDFFGAGTPRLRAAYTEEVNSWWLRAYGFASIGDPALRSKKLYELLDQAFSKEIERVAAR